MKNDTVVHNQLYQSTVRWFGDDRAINASSHPLFLQKILKLFGEFSLLIAIRQFIFQGQKLVLYIYVYKPTAAISVLIPQTHEMTVEMGRGEKQFILSQFITYGTLNHHFKKINL